MSKLIFVIIITLCSFLLSAQTLNISSKPSEEKLEVTLIKEVVRRSEIYDQVNFYYKEAGNPNQAKLVADLQQGNIDVSWFGTSSAYEKDLQAVYIPIYRGLLGMRIAIIEQNKADIFANTKTFQQFKKFIPCQGKMWADTSILEANDLNVAKSLGYPNIFPMVEADRCDYFPRAVFEPFAEVEQNSQYNLMVDEYVMLRYKMPYFPFVAKENKALAEHIEKILAEMFADGTFQKLFFADSQVKRSLQLAKLENRIIFDLKNPDLTDNVKNIPEVMWFNPLEGEQ